MYTEYTTVYVYALDCWTSQDSNKRKAKETPVEAEVPDEDDIDEQESEESEESMVLVDGKSKFSFFNIICDILG